MPRMRGKRYASCGTVWPPDSIVTRRSRPSLRKPFMMHEMATVLRNALEKS